MIPHARNPINTGNTESITKLPIKALIGTAIKVARHPVKAAPIPAICPNGCMAKARKFPKIKPTAKNSSAKKHKTTQYGGFTPD